MDVFSWILTCIGHLGLWCAAFNLIHASSFPRTPRKISEKIIALLAIGPIVWVLFRSRSEIGFDASELVFGVRFYFWVCFLFGGFVVARWIFRMLTMRRPTRARLTSSEYLDVERVTRKKLLAGFKAKLLAQVPGNQFVHLRIEHWNFEVPCLPSHLQGLCICQISDLHWTGMVQRDFYDYVIERVNRADPDLVFLTGDILDERHCLDWIVPILSKVKSSHGRYYVLGNHDRRIRDTAAIHQRMSAAGWIHVADGRWHEVAPLEGTLWLAGNEIPWYREARKLPDDLPVARSDVLKVLLSHSPDQISWSVRRGFDLVFAGHTHGGQIQIPLIGPVIAPSRHGVKYASGTFCFDKTLVHVSRGLSADEPIRLFCPPELGFFKLVRSGVEE